MELQLAARDKLLQRDQAREAIFKGKSIEFLMTYLHHNYIQVQTTSTKEYRTLVVVGYDCDDLYLIDC